MKGGVRPRAELERALGYHFHDPGLLMTALTPPSAGLSPDNQRLEFLGDALLEGAVTQLIYREKQEWSEGAMSKLRGMLVCTETLCGWASELGIQLAQGPRSTKHGQATSPRKPLADAMEAVVAAIFLDAQAAGGDPHAAVAILVEAKFLTAIREAFIGIWQERDSKTTLQERAAVLGLPAPVYELVERGGPDHAPVFTVRVQLGTQHAIATAGTLKGAQVAAARLLLADLPGRT